MNPDLILMIWLTKRVPAKWYVSVRCEQCETRSVLFRDDTNGKGEFELAYYFKCANCRREDVQHVERYWYPRAPNPQPESVLVTYH